jgi:uncharacterized protein YndB with AHSA1/START domain
VKTILHVLDIDAGPSRVWQALATEEGLAGWWSTKVSADMRLGGVIDWTFQEGFNPDMEITELSEESKMAWRCIGGHEPWGDNTFVFEIKPLDGQRTQLWMRQDYAQELSDEAYGIYNFNWGYYLHSLQQFAANGTGHPFEPPAD